jgi:hypothetical protein
MIKISMCQNNKAWKTENKNALSCGWRGWVNL